MVVLAPVAAVRLERFAETGRLDPAYLASLSDDAVPALDELSIAVRRCLLAPAERDDDWLEWNLGRQPAGDPPLSDRARHGGCGKSGWASQE